jgi:putative membrane protein
METTSRPATPLDDERILALERPDKNLMVLYALMSCLATIAAPIVIIPLYFKYHTLRYKLDREGVSASWGILFRREVHLTYKRIQDIHLKRNFVERWLGIATIQVQTASGSSSSELSFEGIREFEALREFLYRRMRGHEMAPAGASAQSGAGASTPAGPAWSGALASGGATASGATAGSEADVVALLRSIQGEIEATRRALESRI